MTKTSHVQPKLRQDKGPAIDLDLDIQMADEDPAYRRYREWCQSSGLEPSGYVIWRRTTNGISENKFAPIFE
jgi:hypothetical protein